MTLFTHHLLICAQFSRCFEIEKAGKGGRGSSFSLQLVFVAHLPAGTSKAIKFSHHGSSLNGNHGVSAKVSDQRKQMMMIYVLNR